ncbi:hypothetical protein LAZ67_5002685 [Cordylochernes scorpioides]|uniref:Integrase p58-like C-terminal domain-containing protein n=1 Tax=Cordylochernes scorpioides TaxID=51811 RepID=A0ABY6KGK5_9ARAC|nr:hypothetical protein LAZ67_5002685 [Cordylochernes scorpioides]
MYYNVGDLVWIFIPIIEVALSEKLMKRYFGPYKITRKLFDVTFEVEPVDQPTRRRRTRDLVHVLRMKPYHDLEDQADLSNYIFSRFSPLWFFAATPLPPPWFTYSGSVAPTLQPYPAANPKNL